MGSPISVVIAELTMQNIEKKIDINCFNGNQILLWKRYVDDCIAIIKTTDIDAFLQYINNINHNIQFTVEIEQNNKLLSHKPTKS